jgi:hypothetical protein
LDEIENDRIVRKASAGFPATINAQSTMPGTTSGWFS